MFNGSSERRVKVSMRGKRKGPERKGIVNRAKEQREARAEERNRRNAALLLQRVYRGRSATGAARRRRRDDFDGKVRDIERVAAIVQAQTKQAFRAPPHIAAALARDLLFFFDAELDADAARLRSVAVLLRDAATNPGFFAPLAAPQADGLAVTLAAFFRAGLRHAQDADVLGAFGALLAPLRGGGGDGAEAARLRTRLLWALLCACVSLGTLASDGGRFATAAQLYRVRRGGEVLLPHAACGGGAAALDDAAVWPVLDADGGGSVGLDAAAAAALRLPPLLRRAVGSLTLRMLSAPGAPGGGGGALQAQLRARGEAAMLRMLGALTAVLSSKLEAQPLVGLGDAEAVLSPAELLALVQNLVALPLLESAALRAPFLRLLSLLLRDLPLAPASGDAGGDGDGDDDMDMQDDGGGGGADDDDDDEPASLLEAAFIAILTRERGDAARRLDVGGNADVRRAAAALLACVTSSEQLLAALLVEDAGLACGVFARVVLLDASLLRNLGGAIDHWAGAAEATDYAAPVLKALAFGGSAALLALWEHLMGAAGLGAYAEKLAAPDAGNAERDYAPAALVTSPAVLPGLLLYFAGLSHALIATDDEDFFVAGKPVPPAVALRTVLVLKMVLHALLWANTGALRRPPEIALALAASRLLRQLRERSSRLKFSRFDADLALRLERDAGFKSFASEDLWVWPRTTINCITAALVPDGGVQSLDQAEHVLAALAPARGAAARGAAGGEDASFGGGSAAGAMDITDKAAPPRSESDERISRVLRDVPDLLPFKSRVAIFERLIEADKAMFGAAQLQSAAFFGMPLDSRGAQLSRIRVRRGSVFEDSFQGLSSGDTGARPLRGRIQVTFVNEHGMEEAGIDGGGLLKEWMDAVCKDVFDPQYGFFVTTGAEDGEAGNQVSPSYASGVLSSEHLEGFRFAGRILGKALYEGILVEPQLSPPFINKLLGRYNHVDDLKFLDQALHRGLMSMKRMARDKGGGGDAVDAVEALGMYFQIDVETFGARHSVDLMPNGSDVPVTSANALRYIYLVSHFKLNMLTRAQSEAFLRGFRELIPETWLRMFNAPEVQLLIGGDGYRPLDIEDLKANVNYHGFHQSQPYVQAFWRTIEELSPQEQADFLRFITSCSRQPLLGFRSIYPKIAIHMVPEEPPGRLPSAATCMNLLKLPRYADVATLKEKLRYAISANAGFDLS